MMIPEFIRFYSYTVSQALDEYAVTFFSLINSMYRLQAQEQLSSIMTVSAGMAGGKEASGTISALEKQAKGLHGIVQEVRNIKNVKH